MCPTPETILRLLDGDLPASQHAALRQHLALCLSCRNVLADLRSTCSLLEHWEVNLPPDPALAGRIVGSALRERHNPTRCGVSSRTAVISVAASVAIGYLAALALPTSLFRRPEPVSPEVFVQSLGLDRLSETPVGLAGLFDPVAAPLENPS